MQDRDDDESRLERVPSLVPGLDLVLHGGFFAGGVYIIRGAPGAGKTILANQICFRHVAAGGRALYITLLAESHARMRQHMQEMAFYDAAAVPDGLYYVSGFGALEQDGVPALLDLVRREVRKKHATLLVMDGLVTVEEASGSDRAHRKLIHELQAHAEAQGCVVLLLTNGNRRDFHPEHTMVDGVISLEDVPIGKHMQRELEVRKFRGSASLRGRHAFRISDEGFVVHPRFEALYGRSAEPRPTLERTSSGIVALDQMLGGGLPKGSTTLLLGPSGAGKTSTGLHFLSASTPEEPGLMFGFYEQPARLKLDAQGFGLDFDGLERSGALTLKRFSPAEGILDDLGARLLAEVRSSGARRVLIDGLGGFLQALDLPARMGGFFSALAHELRSLGVTAVLTAEVDNLSTAEASIPIDGISAIAENVILLRYVEREARLHRLMSVLKLRGASFDIGVREFVLEGGRLQLSPDSASARRLTGALPAMAQPPPSGGSE